MPTRRPATPATLLGLVAAGSFAVGFAGTAAYVTVTRYLQDQTAGPDQVVAQSSATSTPAQPPCPQETIDRVRAAGRPGNLVTLLYVRGTKAGGEQGEGWICRDDDGTLYYQGHDLDGRPWAEGDNALLVGRGINGQVTRDGPTYIATVDFGTYRISPTEFRLVGNNGSETVWVLG